MKTIAWGVLLTAGACWFWWQEIGRNPLNELALIRHGVTAPGFITDTWEDVEDDFQGRAHWFHGGTYTYRLPDGSEFTGRIRGSGRLRKEFAQLERPYPVDVEYLPYNPSVSRIKGAGCQTVAEWLWRKMGLGLFLLALFCLPGVYLIWTGLRNTKRLLAAKREFPSPVDQPGESSREKLQQ